MVAQHCVSNSCQWIVHLKMVKMTKILNVHLYLYCASISVSICIYHSLENLQTRGHHNCIPFGQWQREILKAARGNKICPVQRIKIRVTRFFSQKKMQTRSGWSNFSEGPKEKQPAGLVWLSGYEGWREPPSDESALDFDCGGGRTSLHVW